jgi:molybdopterin molybdotransferase
MTGAPVPANTEAVIPVEQSDREDGHVRFAAAPARGAHLRRRGESIRAGTLLVAAGRRLTPGDVALLATAGVDPAPVFRRPRLAIAATGDELVAPAAAPGPGQLRDSNGPMLAALCRARGWESRVLPRAADDAAGLARLFERAAEEADLLVTSGGVSAGDLDLLPAAAARAGFELVFHGVAMRPGKPVALGRRGGATWLGLPGNPVSTAVGFHLFGREIAGRLEGDGRPGAPRVPARLDGALPAAGPREVYRDALWRIAGGESRVGALASVGSHDIAAHARANALLRQPADSPALEDNAPVECLVLGAADSEAPAASG